MGREVKRVPLDFNWPLDTPWGGYLQPDYRPCPWRASGRCVHGSTLAGAWLGVIVQHLMILGDDARRGELHPWVQHLALAPDLPPGADMTELTTALAGRAHHFMGHDTLDKWSATKKIIEAAGLDPNVWGVCPACRGHVVHPDDYEKREAWEPTEPPTGPGWQVWENVTEGSPISPVFELKENLADWMYRHYGGSIAGWLQLCVEGYAPSMIIADGKVMDSAEALDHLAKEKE